MSYTPESDALLLIRGILGVSANVRAIEEAAVSRVLATLRAKESELKRQAARAPLETVVGLSSAYTYAAGLFEEIAREIKRSEEHRYEAEPRDP